MIVRILFVETHWCSAYQRQIIRDSDCKLPNGDDNKISKCKINMDNDPSKDVYFDSCKLWSIPPDLFFKVRTLQKTYLNLSNNHLIELHNETNSLSDLVRFENQGCHNCSISFVIIVSRYI